jgi:hypothetical protein
MGGCTATPADDADGNEESMRVLLDTSHSFDEAEKELGCEVEQLLTPLTRFQRQRPEGMFAIDNGAFSGLKIPAFLSLLEREYEARKQCRFVAVPDVVASAIRTLEIFEAWRYRLQSWPLALVAQDGQESLPIPWAGIEAVFIGGSTSWKMSQSAAHVIKAAQALGKWVHVGRVNTPARFEYFEKLGADSIDGTGLSRYSWMREAIYEKANRPRLFEEAA